MIHMILNTISGNCLLQLIIMMALAKGRSRVRCGPVTLHTQTAIHIAQIMTEVRSSSSIKLSNNVCLIHIIWLVSESRDLEGALYKFQLIDGWVTKLMTSIVLLCHCIKHQSMYISYSWFIPWYALMKIVRSLNRSWTHDRYFSLCRSIHWGECLDTEKHRVTEFISLTS